MNDFIKKYWVTIAAVLGIVAQPLGQLITDLITAFSTGSNWEPVLYGGLKVIIGSVLTYFVSTRNPNGTTAKCRWGGK